MMKKFIFKLAIFSVLFLISDTSLGLAAQYLASRAKGGQTLKDHEIGNTVKADVLILGSSRSTHHYVPELMADSLGLSCYIIGQNGNGVVLMWPLLQIVSERHKPKLVIYDITPKFDLQTDDMHRYLRCLRPLWNKYPAINNAICTVDPSERIKNISHAFRYNSSIPSLLKGAFLPDKPMVNGYVPLHGQIKYKESTIPEKPFVVSPEKISFFEDMIDYCKDKGITFIMTYSPSYDYPDSDQIRYI